MAKYILKQEAVSALISEANTHNNPVKRAYTRAAAIIEQITAADVQPVEHSRWIPMNDGTYNAYCENCGHERGSKAWNKADYKYCPNCGARMDGEQNENN